MLKIQLKKGQMTNVLMPIVLVAIILVVIAIVMAVGQQLLTETATGMRFNEGGGTSGCNSTTTTNCSYAYNSTINMQDGLGKISAKFPLIGTVIVLVIVIALLFMVFAYVRQK